MKHFGQLAGQIYDAFRVHCPESSIGILSDDESGVIYAILYVGRDDGTVEVAIDLETAQREIDSGSDVHKIAASLYTSMQEYVVQAEVVEAKKREQIARRRRSAHRREQLEDL